MCLKEQTDPGRQSRNPDVYAMQESDRPIVPEKAANEAKAEESREGRGRTKENT